MKYKVIKQLYFAEGKFFFVYFSCGMEQNIDVEFILKGNLTHNQILY